jgi:argininosuccinate lyase
VAKLEADPKYIEADVEDVHSFVEERLSEIVGELAGQAHLGRSRNEQTVTALRLFSKGAIDALSAAVASSWRARRAGPLRRRRRDARLHAHARGRADHVRHLGGAHAWGLVRDRERLRRCAPRVDVLPLGSGALAGTRFRSTARRWRGPRLRRRLPRTRSTP